MLDAWLVRRSDFAVQGPGRDWHSHSGRLFRTRRCKRYKSLANNCRAIRCGSYSSRVLFGATVALEWMNLGTSMKFASPTWVAAGPLALVGGKGVNCLTDGFLDLSFDGLGLPERDEMIQN